MANSYKAPSVTPVVGLIYSDEGIRESVQEALVKRFGSLGMQSEVFPFNKTNYYEGELGEALKRVFLIHEELRDPGELPDWKHFTIELESKFSAKKENATARQINIDPGYLRGATLVLGSTKGNVHRIYLRDGIYAEMTMYSKNGEWITHDHTLLDFKSGQYDEFLTKARQYHVDQTHKLND